MRRVLLRAAILVGGSIAGVVIGLSVSSAAHADDRPGLLDGVTGVVEDVTGVVEAMLPPPVPPRAPAEPKPEPPAAPAPESDDAPTKPATPIKDTVETITTVVENVVNETPVAPIVDKVAAALPPPPPPAQETPTGPGLIETVVDILTPPVPETVAAGQSPAPTTGTETPTVTPARAGDSSPPTPPDCADTGHPRQVPGGPVHHRATGTVHAPRQQRVAPATVGDTPPHPGHPPGPAQEATTATGHNGAHSSTQLDALPAVGTPPHHLTADPATPNRHTATGRTTRPTAPSG